MERTIRSVFKEGMLEVEVWSGKVDGTPVMLFKPLDTNLFKVGTRTGAVLASGGVTSDRALP